MADSARHTTSPENLVAALAAIGSIRNQGRLTRFPVLEHSAGLREIGIRIAMGADAGQIRRHG